ncbi:MAG: NINE protein [Mycobacteriaceae bacterium]|nr:NINE protein [Mycobacteriaceae bacterium]
MTDQPWSGAPEPAPPPPGAGYPPPPCPPPPFPPPPFPPPPFPPQYNPQYGAGYDPSAPFGRHPVTGQPYSDKSKMVAGLLQLLGLFGLVGFGRIYAGYVGLGIAQLLVGWVTCGLGAWVWGIIDAVLFMTDKVTDPQGRPLRDGA